jgi:hypothetical protein
MTSKNPGMIYENNHANTRTFFNELNENLKKKSNVSTIGGGPKDITNDLNFLNAAFIQLNELYQKSDTSATLPTLKSSQVISATFLQLVNKIIKIN